MRIFCVNGICAVRIHKSKSIGVSIRQEKNSVYPKRKEWSYKMKNKIKTHSGAKKRFRFTASGKPKYQSTNRRHRLTQKATGRKRSNRSNEYADKADIKEIRALMPYAK